MVISRSQLPLKPSQDDCVLEAKDCRSRITLRFWDCLWTVAYASITTLLLLSTRSLCACLSCGGWRETSTHEASSHGTRPRYGRRLDAVQRRALRLVGIEEDQHSFPGMTSLEHRRDVSALVVCHKVQVQEVPHLSSLRLPPQAVQRWSRTTPLSDVLVKVPRSHSKQHQRTYTARTSRLWNMFAAATPDVQNMTTHQVKLAAHRWCETQTSPLAM
ncbi:hypothetical protein GWK47_005372 [Chionoecetes opilio]|uniref:Uncharacterized protein n=1 Tax=Chionoecetes opilio TaxID=41210 RepID=A0A8J4YNK6_CHIOP|nr:hypothetical protein GWK47_005372 [Chionoecetes opilio]